MLHTLLICEYRYCNLQVNGKRVLMLLCWFLACQGTVEIWKAKIEVNTNQENEQEHEFEYKLSIAGVGQLGLEQQWPPGLSWSWLAMPVSNRAVLRPRPHPHPTQTQRHSYIQRRAAKTAILNVENGSSKVIKCLQGKSLNLNRPHWCRFSYALTNPHMYHILSNVKWKRWKKISLRFKVKGSENETSNSWLFPTITGTECGAENVLIQKFSV